MEDADNLVLRLGLAEFFPKIFLQDQPALPASISSSPFFSLSPGKALQAPLRAAGSCLCKAPAQAWPGCRFLQRACYPSPFWKENLLQVGFLWPVHFQPSPTFILGSVCLGSVLPHPMSPVAGFVPPCSGCRSCSRQVWGATVPWLLAYIHHSASEEPDLVLVCPYSNISSPRPSLTSLDLPTAKTQLSQLFFPLLLRLALALQ